MYLNIYFVHIHFLIGHIRLVCSLFENESVLKNPVQIYLRIITGFERRYTRPPADYLLSRTTMLSGSFFPQLSVSTSSPLWSSLKAVLRQKFCRTTVSPSTALKPLE